MIKSGIGKWGLMMFLIIGIFVFTSNMASASQWIKTYGGSNDDWVFSIQQTSDGGYIVAGKTISFGAGPVDAWVLKLDGSGNMQWQTIYGGSSHDHANSIQQTSDGGYIVAGKTASFGFAGLYDAWVLKLDGNGNVQWQTIYGGRGTDCANSIKQTSDGGYVIAGYTDSFDAGGYDAWVFKLDGSGNVQWQKTYGGTNGDFANSIQQTTDGGYIVAVGTGSFGAGLGDAWVFKLDGSGNVQWQKTYGGTNGDFANSIQQTTDGGYIVAGYTGSFGAGYWDTWVLKLDGSGNVQWQKTYGGTIYDWANFIQQTSDGGYIVVGETRSFGAGSKDVWVLKLDDSGNVQWQKTYGGTIPDEISGPVNSIQQTSDGGYIVASWTNSFGAGGYDAWVLKLDGSGNIYNVCSIVKTSDAQVSDTYATVQDTNMTGTDSNVSPQTSTASVSDTNAVVKEQCIYGCNLVPDATSVHRGGTLGLQGTVTNNTNNTGSVLFGTKVTLPNGNRYPASGYLIGPLNISLDPSQSKSGHRSHAIPLTAPPGTYTYHGYVGNYGAGIYDECWFNFTVTEQGQGCTLCHQ